MEVQILPSGPLPWYCSCSCPCAWLPPHRRGRAGAVAGRENAESRGCGACCCGQNWWMIPWLEKRKAETSAAKMTLFVTELTAIL